MKKNIAIIALAVVGVFALTAALPDVPDVITLKGDKKGPVEFPHKAHVDLGQTCKECHHTVEGDMDVPTQKCSDCHTKDSEVKAMKAFHNNCIDCHKTSNKESGTEAPTKCKECHQG